MKVLVAENNPQVYSQYSPDFVCLDMLWHHGINTGCLMTNEFAA